MGDVVQQPSQPGEDPQQPGPPPGPGEKPPADDHSGHEPGDARPADPHPGDSRPGDSQHGGARPGDALSGDALQPFTPADAAPAGPASPGAGSQGETDPGAALDPEQLRQFQQFQQFQRFQELQRQRGAEAPQHSTDVPPPPVPYGYYPYPPRPPLWRRLLNRFVRRLIYVAVALVGLIIAFNVAFDYVFGSSDDDDRPAEETGGGTYETNPILPTSPREAVRMVYQNIAQGRADLACGRFGDDVQPRFARNMGAADCQAAVESLHQAVTSRNNYAEPTFPRDVDPAPEADTVRISSCEMRVRDGPELGMFTVSRVEQGQWLITDHDPEPDPCPGTESGG
ncbi:hypothetical protein [Haloechinothrix alba]|nr:hypothetical protein [Haloechinothrix alba]